MSFIGFLKERAGLSDQSVLVGPVDALARELKPWMLGQIYRIHLHIRAVARKLLTARVSEASKIDEQRIQVIIENLTEQAFQHGHAIGRREAEGIGLNITRPSDTLENMLWELLEEYEDLLQIRHPIDPQTFVPAAEEERTEDDSTCSRSVRCRPFLPGRHGSD